MNEENCKVICIYSGVKYYLTCGYGTIENIYYLVAATEGLIEMNNKLEGALGIPYIGAVKDLESTLDAKSLYEVLGYNKEEAIFKGYEIEGLRFFLLDEMYSGSFYLNNDSNVIACEMESSVKVDGIISIELKKISCL